MTFIVFLLAKHTLIHRLKTIREIAFVIYFQLCIGYRHCRWKVVVFYIFVALSLGILYLITYWQPHWRVHLTSKICNLSHADTVILQVSLLRLCFIQIIWWHFSFFNWSYANYKKIIQLKLFSRIWTHRITNLLYCIYWKK